MSDWREEVVVHPATNARIRYFWNAVTGAQQFNLPDTYFPRNFNSAGTWVSPEPTAKHVNLTQGLGLKATSNTDGTAPRGSSQFPPIKP